MNRTLCPYNQEEPANWWLQLDFSYTRPRSFFVCHQAGTFEIISTQLISSEYLLSPTPLGIQAPRS
jgi:hypothetical protein